MGPPLRSFAPMRMTASWFGSLDPPNTRLWRDRSALERGLPSDRHLADPARLHSMVQPCSELSRPSPAGGRRRGEGRHLTDLIGRLLWPGFSAKTCRAHTPSRIRGIDNDDS